MIDESQIEYLLNGERAEADVLNRPLRQLVSATNASLGEVNVVIDEILDTSLDVIREEISTVADNTELLIEERYDEIFDVIKDGNGFTREKDAQLIFDADNATVSIAPGLGKSTWFYYHRGRKIESSETLTYTLSEADKTNGGFYLSFGKDGNFVNTGPYPDFYKTTLCFYVHYSNGEFIIEGDERHAADRDTAWHHSHHREDGMVIYTLGSVDWTPDDANKVGIQITSTLVADEDLQHLIKHSPTGEEPFNQILEGSQDTVRIPTLYYDGNIRYLADKKIPWVVDALKYNDNITLKDVPNGKFVNYFLVATHCQKYPIKLIMGRKIFDSEDETVDETLESLGLNFPEMALLYRISLERDNSLSTVGKCKLKSVQQAASKITFESAAGSAGSGLSNHAQLLGRNDDNAHPASAITGLGTAATRNVGTNTGDVMEVGTFGIGNTFAPQVFDANEIANQVGNKSGFYPYISDIGSTNIPHPFVYINQLFLDNGAGTSGLIQIAYGFGASSTWIRTRLNGEWFPWLKQLSSDDIGESVGQVMAVGTFGFGDYNPVDLNYDVNDLPAGQRISLSDGITETDAVALNLPALGGLGTYARSWHVECVGSVATRLVQTATEVFGIGSTKGRTFTRVKHDVVWTPWQEVYKSNHVVETPGVSTTNIMSQAAVTNQLANKAPLSHTHPWAQVTGQPATATRWPTFTEVTGKPATYNPSSHTHPWAQVTGQPATATRWPTFTEVTGSPATATRWPTYDEVSGKPTSFTPASHTHPWSQVTGQPATATRWPTFAEVSGKPTSFTPASHTHSVSEVTGLGTAATKDVGTATGQVMGVGAGGWLGQGESLAEAYGYPASIADVTNQTKVIRTNVADNGVRAYAAGIHFSSYDTWGRLRIKHDSPGAWVQGGNANAGTGWTAELYHTENKPTTADVIGLTTALAAAATTRSTDTTDGGIRTRIVEDTLWMTNDGTDA